MTTSNAPDLQIEGLTDLPVSDCHAIEKTLTALLAGFSTRNADQLAGVYADDADWVNAFGSVKRGPTEIVEYLRGLFADANFEAGRLVAPPQSRLRRLSDDIVLVSTRLEIRDQGLVGRGVIARRDNHSLRALQRQQDKSWKIVSEMYMDARSDLSYAGHS